MRLKKQIGAGFSLVEVVLALGITSFCCLVLVGMLASGITSSHSSVEQTAALNIITSIVSDLKSTPSSTGTVNSPHYNIPLPLTVPMTLYLTDDGTAVGQPASAQYRVVITESTAPTGRMATWLDVKVSSPSAAAPSNANIAVESFVALDRN